MLRNGQGSSAVRDASQKHATAVSLATEQDKENAEFISKGRVGTEALTAPVMDVDDSSRGARDGAAGVRRSIRTTNRIEGASRRFLPR